MRHRTSAAAAANPQCSLLPSSPLLASKPRRLAASSYRCALVSIGPAPAPLENLRPDPRPCPCPCPLSAPGLTPAQLTALNLDRTAQLEAAAAGRWGGEVAALVGEMQFAFIAFVCGQSLQGA